MNDFEGLKGFLLSGVDMPGTIAYRVIRDRGLLSWFDRVLLGIREQNLSVLRLGLTEDIAWWYNSPTERGFRTQLVNALLATGFTPDDLLMPIPRDET